MSRPSLAPPAPAPDSAPELVAELRRVRQNIAMEMAHHDAEASRLRRIDTGLCQALARLGHVAPDDPAITTNLRLVQGLDDVRGQVEHLDTRQHQVEQLLATVQRQQERLIAAVETYTVGVAELGGAVGAKVLASDQYAVQANELLRGVLRKLDQAPGAITNAVSAALPTQPYAVEVGGGSARRRRPTRKPAA